MIRAYRGQNCRVDGAEQGKPALRERFLAARQARSADELERARRAICEHVIAWAHGATVICGYVPMRTEPGSLDLLAGLHALGATVLVPLTRPDRDLDWAPWRPAAIGAPLGVAAITDAGLVLVPALAVAANGTRLGGGSYDRALASCRASTVVAALLFDDELVDELPSDAWDRPVSAVVTPSGWQRVARNT
jgi:5-formyltetrahydrofolate cyclo-ligase